MSAQSIICPTVLLHPKAKAPKRSSDFAIGHDICCVSGIQGLDEKFKKTFHSYLESWQLFEDRGYYMLHPHTGFLFRTGFAQAIHPDYACLLWDRSSLGGVRQVHRFAGVIDPDYRGEWFVRLYNHSDEPVTFEPGDKIVQGVYQLRVEAECPVVDSLSDSVRGIGAFGSTGR